MSQSTPLVVVGVTGCIAAYKACELVRALVHDGVRVKAVMTNAATRFLGPLTLRTLTGETVALSLWDDPGTAPVHHISLAQEADVLVIAPCTANVLAKLAHGRADDILTTTALAFDGPVVIAPAMNTLMWRADVTQNNVSEMRRRGALIVSPETGELACGDEGEGRLAALGDILGVVRGELARSRDCAGVRVLVTAGPTHEPLDAVRFLGNRSSGKTGYAIAEEAARRGAEVTLVSGPTELPDAFGVGMIRVQTALEMREAVQGALKGADVVIATAAVADVRPAHPSDGKLKKDVLPTSVELASNPDILAELGESKGARVLVGFAAETEDLIAAARVKLERKHLDLVVANDVSQPGLGFGTDSNRVVFVLGERVRELPVMSKRDIARELVDEVVRLLGERRARKD